MPITCGDRVVAFLGLTDLKGSDQYTPGYSFTPLSLPIRGSYNDYGSVENIDETPAVKILEERFGKPIDELLDIAERYDVGETWDVYETFVDEIVSATPYFVSKRENLMITLIMEHEVVFDQMVKMAGVEKRVGKDYDNDVAEYKAINEFKVLMKEKYGTDDPDELELSDKLESDINGQSIPKDELLKIDRFLLYGSPVKHISPKCMSFAYRKSGINIDYLNIYRWHELNSDVILYPYRNIELKPEYKKEFTDFAGLIFCMINLNLVWGVSNYYSQRVNYKDCIKLLKTELALMKAKAKEKKC